ncbi:zinc finger matrin-type protein 5 [Periophthalmus magnuspinnatus]|uniref:Zinc finger matrin-type protein 5 n=1 Tax=Periophthalmus magnuspinnatus TaxID=409849 RepID=A0A3B4AS91_9GOBI|nr:zinc finger matrin-type protein 5 [Periophthalmus magnuspinnatus]
MGKRYYCDYCERSFQDNMHNRKKHLNGVQHHRAKKAWFDFFKDPEAILLEEQAKKPCRMFLQKGICDFGPNCRFSHMSDQDFYRLRRQVEGGNSQEHFEDKILSDRSVEEWLTRREKRRNALCSAEDVKTDTEESPEETDVPQHLLLVPDLPPSLRPPPPGGWKVSANTEWG